MLARLSILAAATAARSSSGCQAVSGMLSLSLLLQQASAFARAGSSEADAKFAKSTIIFHLVAGQNVVLYVLLCFRHIVQSLA